VTSTSRRGWMAMAGAAALAPGFAHAADALPKPGLDALARAKGLRFGTAIGGRTFADPRYRALVLAECGVIVPENELKWYVIRARGPQAFDFGPADRLADFARKNRLEMRGHTLLWHHPKWFPAWVATYDFGARPAVEAERMLTEHVQALVGRYGGLIHSWDVVNETVDAATGKPRETAFTKAMGDPLAPVDLAFRAARAADPKAQLVYNDYMSWEAGHEAHRAGVLRLLEGFRKRGVPVDALGVQSHIGTDNNQPTAGFDTRHVRDWRRFLDEVVGMGYGLVITEFDVHDNGLPADVAIRDSGVASFAKDYLDVMLSYRQMQQVLAWGLVDKYSWLQQRWARPDGLPKRPTLYDDDYRPKLLREAVAAALRAAPAR
jgi:endo-1,4-beta-xylanase